MGAFEQLSNISELYRKAATGPSAAWRGSPFEWLLSVPSRSKGAYGEKFVAELFRANDFEVKKPLSGTDHDRVINGHRIEIKLSTSWAGSDSYTFQQIRDQDYDYVLCLGISPQDAHCWVVPKSEIQIGKSGVSHQHGGQRGSDTLWLTFSSKNPPEWIQAHGGSLKAGMSVMKSKGMGSFSGKPIPQKDQVFTEAAVTQSDGRE